MPLEKRRTWIEFSQKAQATPMRQAVLNAGGGNVRSAEWDAINTASNLELGLSNHLLLRAMGFDEPVTSSMKSVALDDRYGLALAYEKIRIDGKKLVDTPAAAKEMADQTYTGLERHARLFVEQNKIAQIS